MGGGLIIIVGLTLCVGRDWVLSVTESLGTAVVIGPVAPASDGRWVWSSTGMITAGTKRLSYAHIPAIKWGCVIFHNSLRRIL